MEVDENTTQEDCLEYLYCLEGKDCVYGIMRLINVAFIRNDRELLKTIMECI